MRVGTKSVLFGAHCFLLHGFFVAKGWSSLYGFPRDPRLWLAFFVHDVGYLGCRDVEGPEGEEHVQFGARIMGALCGMAVPPDGGGKRRIARVHGEISGPPSRQRTLHRG